MRIETFFFATKINFAIVRKRPSETFLPSWMLWSQNFDGIEVLIMINDSHLEKEVKKRCNIQTQVKAYPNVQTLFGRSRSNKS